MAPFTDAEWIRRLKQADKQAQEALWTMLYTFGFNLKGRYHPNEELIAAAVLAAYERIRTRGVYQFAFRCPFQWYCLRILANEVRRALARQQRQEEELDEELIGTSGREQPLDPDKLSAQLQPCLDALSPRSREIIERLYIQAQRPQLVADALQISRNSVNVIACRARRELRACLEGRGYQAVRDFG